MSRVLWLKQPSHLTSTSSVFVRMLSSLESSEKFDLDITIKKEKKIALSAHDDKRCLQPGMTDILPWGHYKIVIEAASNEEASREEGIEPPNTAASTEEASREEGIELSNTAASNEEASREEGIEPPNTA